MDTAAMVASDRGFEYYFWSHADVVHLATSEEEPLFAPVAIREFRDILDSTFAFIALISIQLFEWI